MKTLEPYVGPAEKNVPMPASNKGNGLLRARMVRLSVGESFETEYSPQAVASMAKRIGIKVNRRKVAGMIKRVRVWRIE